MTSYQVGDRVRVSLNADTTDDLIYAEAMEQYKGHIYYVTEARRLSEPAKYKLSHKKDGPAMGYVWLGEWLEDPADFTFREGDYVRVRHDMETTDGGAITYDDDFAQYAGHEGAVTHVHSGLVNYCHVEDADYCDQWDEEEEECEDWSELPFPPQWLDLLEREEEEEEADTPASSMVMYSDWEQLRDAAPVPVDLKPGDRVVVVEHDSSRLQEPFLGRIATVAEFDTRRSGGFILLERIRNTWWAHRRLRRLPEEPTPEESDPLSPGTLVQVVPHPDLPPEFEELTRVTGTVKSAGETSVAVTFPNNPLIQFLKREWVRPN